jgi:hypothetical protein
VAALGLVDLGLDLDQLVLVEVDLLADLVDHVIVHIAAGPHRKVVVPGLDLLDAQLDVVKGLALAVQQGPLQLVSEIIAIHRLNHQSPSIRNNDSYRQLSISVTIQSSFLALLSILTV